MLQESCIGHTVWSSQHLAPMTVWHDKNGAIQWVCHRIVYEEIGDTWWCCHEILGERWWCHMVWQSWYKQNGATLCSCHRLWYKGNVFPPKIHKVVLGFMYYSPLFSVSMGKMITSKWNLFSLLQLEMKGEVIHKLWVEIGVDTYAEVIFMLYSKL
jgi:hypothetical protein